MFPEIEALLIVLYKALDVQKHTQNQCYLKKTGIKNNLII